LARAILHRHPDWNVSLVNNESGFTLGLFQHMLADKPGAPGEHSGAGEQPGVGSPPSTPSDGLDLDISGSRPDVRPTADAAASEQTANGVVGDTSNPPTQQPSDSTQPAAVSMPAVWQSTTSPQGAWSSELRNETYVVQPPAADVSIIAGRPTTTINGVSGSAATDDSSIPARYDGQEQNPEVVAFAIATETDAAEGHTHQAALVPQTVGLHTNLSTFDVPLLDLGAIGDQVSELVKALTESETNLVLVSCVLVVATAGIGCELVRRHHRRVAPELVSTSSIGAAPDFWLLG
jgi:hypothetical protein